MKDSKFEYDQLDKFVGKWTRQCNVSCHPDQPKPKHGFDPGVACH